MVVDTKLVSMRLRAKTRKQLEDLSLRWNASQADVVAFAIDHLDRGLMIRDGEISSALNEVKSKIGEMQNTVNAVEQRLLRGSEAPRFRQILDDIAKNNGDLTLYGARKRKPKSVKSDGKQPDASVEALGTEND